MTLPFTRGSQLVPADPSPVSGVPPQLPDDRLSVVVTHPDGTTTMWGPDEVDAGDVPVDLSFKTSIPGGFADMTCSLLRNLAATQREGLFDDIQVIGPGGAIRWEGRLQQMPGSTDQGGRVTPQAVGWSSHLSDDGTAREIYLDRTQERWGPTALPRKMGVAPSYKLFDGQANYQQEGGNAAGPALHLNIEGYAWSAAEGRPLCELAYDSGGIPIGQVFGNWYSNVASDGNWNFILYSATPEPGAGYSLLQRFSGADPLPAAGYGFSVSAPAGQPNLLIQLHYGLAPAGSANKTYFSGVAAPAIAGRHGVPFVNGGVRASDVIAHTLSRWAPLLRFTKDAGGTITPTEFGIRHLVFPEATTASEIIERVNAYHVWDWAVWENRTFHYGPRGGGRTWAIATADGLDLSLEGDTTDRIYNGVVVSYADYAGTAHTIGPTGSGAQIIDDRLRSQDPTNPATTHGIRRWGTLPLSVPTDANGAATIGQAWLIEQSDATRRGSATVRGWVQDDTGALRPVSEVRAGDRLIVTDRPDDPARRIIATDYTHAGRSNTLTLDSTAASLDAILARVTDALVGVV